MVRPVVVPGSAKMRHRVYSRSKGEREEAERLVAERRLKQEGI